MMNMYNKSKISSKSSLTILKYPILFGGFLSLSALGYVFRYSWLDIEEERKKINKENLEASKLLEDFKNRYKKL